MSRKVSLNMTPFDCKQRVYFQYQRLLFITWLLTWPCGLKVKCNGAYRNSSTQNGQFSETVMSSPSLYASHVPRYSLQSLSNESKQNNVTILQDWKIFTRWRSHFEPFRTKHFRSLVVHLPTILTTKTSLMIFISTGKTYQYFRNLKMLNAITQNRKEKNFIY